MTGTEERTVSQLKPWLKYYSTDPKTIEFPRMSLYAYLKSRSKDFMDAGAINYYGRHIGRPEMFARVDEAANAFAALGLKAGDMVSFVAVAIPETIYAIYALNKIGVCANMVDPRLDTVSITDAIVTSGSKITICLDATYEKVGKILDDIKQDLIIVEPMGRSLPKVKQMAVNLKVKFNVPFGEKIIDWDSFLKLGEGVSAQEAEYEPDRAAIIARTGGTTGIPKGVILTNDSMNASTVNFVYGNAAYEHNDSFLDIIPVFTSYGAVCGMHMPLCMGVEIILIPKFNPAEFGKYVRTYHPNHMISTPAFYEMLMESREVRHMNLSFIKTLGSGGDTMNTGLEERFHSFIRRRGVKYPLAQGYGMSEVSAAATYSVNTQYKSLSVGIPGILSTIGIFNPDSGKELGINCLGEVCISGPTLMKGYLNRPEETAQVLKTHDDGTVWVHSGDLGYVDEDGFLFIKGRMKRMIVRFDGHKLFPVAIESMVHEYPGVVNCCCIGVNDMERSMGQYPLIIVQTGEETADREAFCRDLFAKVYERSEERGKPTAVIAVDEIPLTNAFKNDVAKLEAQYADFDYVAWQAAGAKE